jgi:hypothetical protein
MLRRVLPIIIVLPFVAGGCHGGAPKPAPGPVSSPSVAPVGGPVAFHIKLGAGQTLFTSTPRPDNCPGLDELIDLNSDGTTVRLAAYATSCQVDDNTRPGNGRHGVYRTTADIPADRRSAAVTVPTALGTATAFTQPYYECTNSCKNYTEPVAVVTLDHPAAPAYPTLVAYSPRGSIGLDRLVTVLKDQLRA